MSLRHRFSPRLRLLAWRLRYWWLDTPAGRVACHLGALLFALLAAWRGWALTQLPADAPQLAVVNFWVQLAIMVVASLVMMALAPKPKDTPAAEGEVPVTEDGAAYPIVFGEEWIDAPVLIGWKKLGTANIRGKKSGFSGRPIIGYWYKYAQLFLLARGPIDALLEVRGGDKTAWSGAITGNSRVAIKKRDLWGGDKTGGEGGIDGELTVLMGAPDQLPSAAVTEHFPGETAYRGKALALVTGIWGAFSPYPKRPAFKVRRILQGWAGGEAWYPEKAAVPLMDSAVRMHGPGWEYIIEAFDEPNSAWADWEIPTEGWQQGGELPFSTGGRAWNPRRSNIWIRRTITALVSGITLRIGADNGCVVFVDGTYFGGSNEANENVPSNQNFPVLIPLTAGRTFTVHAKAFAEKAAANDSGNVIDLQFSGVLPTAMNPAHMLYQSITDPMLGAEPVANINDASFRAAADQLYAEGLGLCAQWMPSTESVESFQQRICNLAGASLSRSPIDGTWHLDLVRGGYSLAGLPVLTDDDIIEYSEQPTTVDDAVNQVVVEWFDRERKEQRSTAPVRSLGAMQNAGAVVSETMSYPEVPSEALALRLAARDLQAKAPGRRLPLVATRAAWAWRPGQVVMLQAPRRGIGSMAVRLADVDRGTLRSGAIKLEAVQDVFSMPATVYVPLSERLPEPDDDLAEPVLAALFFERPYANLAATLSPGELTALSARDGYVAAVATPAGVEMGYVLQVDAGAGYQPQDEGGWPATAVTAAAVGRWESVVPMSSARGWEDVALGTMVLWEAEVCRVDALELEAGTVTLARGCGDTIPVHHAAGSRLFVIDENVTVDPDRHLAGATVQAKLLPYTSSDALQLAAAPTEVVTLASRAARPYPPGRLRVDGLREPAQCVTEFTIAWAHRDRLVQASELVEHEAASIGPEPGTTYTVRTYLADMLADEQTEITGTSTTVRPSGSGRCRVEVWAVREELESWQCAFAEFEFRLSPRLPYADQAGTAYADQEDLTYEG